MAEAALQRSVLTIFCHPLGCSSSSAAHLPSLPAPRSLTSCYCWQSQRGQTAHTDTYGSVNLLLGHALALEGHTTLVSPVSLPLPTAPAQDHFTATPRHSWLMSPHGAAVPEPLCRAQAVPGAWKLCARTVPRLQRPSAEGGPELLTPSPGTQLPGTGTRLPELLTEEARRGLARGLSSERGFIHFPTDTFTFAYSTRTGKKNKS